MSFTMKSYVRMFFNWGLPSLVLNLCGPAPRYRYVPKRLSFERTPRALPMMGDWASAPIPGATGDLLVFDLVDPVDVAGDDLRDGSA